MQPGKLVPGVALGLTVALLLLLLLLLWGARRAGSQDALPVATIFVAKPRFDLASVLLPATAPDAPALTAAFPYQRYLASANLRDGRTLRDDLRVLDSLYPAGGRANERLLYGVVTDSLAHHLEPQFAPESFAYLQAVMHWASQFPVLAQLDPARATFYNAVNLYWLKRTTNHLAVAYQRDPTIKYSFGFRHLNQLCREAQCGVAVGFSDSEKVINYVAESRWGYLLHKFWYDAPRPVKVGLLAVGLLILLPYGLLARCRAARR